MNLLELQRRMAEDVRRPLTEDYEMRSFADDGRPVADIAASYISPNSRLSSFERLEIYNRQYWFRLITAVSEDYPTLNALLGQKRFDALILAYLDEHPSTSWTLRDLGAKLPAFLAAHPEFAGRRHRLAVDVANLELAYVDAFDGKQLDPLTTEEAQAIGADSRLFLQPHLRLLELAYPVDNLVLAVKKEMPEVDIVSSAATHRDVTNRAKIPPVKRGKLFLAVHRYDDSVYYRRLEKETFLLLEGLRLGASVAAAASQAFAKSKLTPDAQALLLQQSFAHASQLGWLCPLPGTDVALPHLEMKVN
ncbi:DNA-binding domain-containing protein [Acidipila rosea]|uniref:Putative DNA-binding protein n=1 Tax=Acidipila rosea TaxID=768535 RepID=A0A4R1KZ12_9BACT|nr:DNA-binding domain-containing protein [Acidipila rosea]TCK69753.1 putative DNA-binding protein [Acidipila rosea]